jgi:cell division protein FtsW (lipid II flippase)
MDETKKKYLEYDYLLLVPTLLLLGLGLVAIYSASSFLAGWGTVTIFSRDRACSALWVFVS